MRKQRRAITIDGWVFYRLKAYCEAQADARITCGGMATSAIRRALERRSVATIKPTVTARASDISVTLALHGCVKSWCARSLVSVRGWSSAAIRYELDDLGAPGLPDGFVLPPSNRRRRQTEKERREAKYRASEQHSAVLTF